jgi:hypothetical protein
VAAGADIFVPVNTLAPILPIAAGPTGYARTIGTPHQAVFERGIALALDSGATFHDPEQRAAFEAAFGKS